MANSTNSNPLVFDGAGSKSGTLYVRQIQWVDDNQDIADGNSCVVTLNGQTLTFVTQVNGADFSSVVRWNVGPFDPPVKIIDFSVDTLDAGAVHVWLL